MTLMDERFDKLLGEDRSPADRLATARALLEAPPPRDSTWAALGAAAFLAVSAGVLAAGAVLAPSVDVGLLSEQAAGPGARQGTWPA